MSVSDPLLRELKGYIAILVLKDAENALLDENSDLIFSLCHCLESIFTKGLVRYDGFAPWRCDSFQWFYQLVRKYQKTLPLKFKVIFDQVLANEKTKTAIGKARLLIRVCLKKRCLHIPIQFHKENEDYKCSMLHVNYSRQKSILGNEILLQIFSSLLQQLSFYDFQFDLDNCSFLDESWHLPKLVKTEMVPCEKLGLTLGFPMGYAVIVEIIENSCADELKQRKLISVGDIWDDINGIPVRNLFGSKIDDMFKKVRSQPFHLTFIKGRNPKTSQIYLPVIKLYRILGLDPLLLEPNRSEEEEFLRPPFSALPEEPKDRSVGSEIGKCSRCQSTLNNEDSTREFQPQPPDLLSSSPAGVDQSGSECEQKPVSKSQLQPYPQSQNNTSSNSALNLQMHNSAPEQLIV